MAETTGIEWTDATVNFWWGCTKVGPGCDRCYAETWSGRFGESLWGVGAPRRKIKAAGATLNRLDNGYAEWAADAECRNGNAKAFGLPSPGVALKRRVFIQSMSDLFDTEVPLEWFAEAWAKIVQCDRVEIQIVTKRISVVEKRLAAIGVTTWPKHVGLLVTVCNQDEADRDIPRLLALKAKLGVPWIGVSAEPLLGPISFRRIKIGSGWQDVLAGWRDCEDYPGREETLDWIIVGGESGPGARLMEDAWAESIVVQCTAAGTAVFVKQMGGPVKARMRPIPQHLMVRQFPEARRNIDAEG
jgi:protein gp37